MAAIHKLGASGVNATFSRTLCERYGEAFQRRPDGVTLYRGADTFYATQEGDKVTCKLCRRHLDRVTKGK